jgi:hypothetical protein
MAGQVRLLDHERLAKRGEFQAIDASQQGKAGMTAGCKTVGPGCQNAGGHRQGAVNQRRYAR